MQHLWKTVCGEELARARELIAILSADHGILSARLLAGMYDRVSTNVLPCAHCKVVCPSLLDGCFINTIDGLIAVFHCCKVPLNINHPQHLCAPIGSLCCCYDVRDSYQDQPGDDIHTSLHSYKNKKKIKNRSRDSRSAKSIQTR